KRIRIYVPKRDPHGRHPRGPFDRSDARSRTSPGASRGQWRSRGDQCEASCRESQGCVVVSEGSCHTGVLWKIEPSSTPLFLPRTALLCCVRSATHGGGIEQNARRNCRPSRRGRCMIGLRRERWFRIG